MNSESKLFQLPSPHELQFFVHVFCFCLIVVFLLTTAKKNMGFRIDEISTKETGHLLKERYHNGVVERTYVMYHGTTFRRAANIHAKGFTRTPDGMLGAGIYLSRDIKKAAQYATAGNGRPGIIIKCEVQVGRVKKVASQDDKFQKSWRRNGYDTAWVPSNNRMKKRNGVAFSQLTENCVSDPRRIKVIQYLKKPEHWGGCTTYI